MSRRGSPAPCHSFIGAVCQTFELEQARKLAMVRGNASAAVLAVIAKAKLHGLIHRDQAGSIPARVVEATPERQGSPREIAQLIAFASSSLSPWRWPPGYRTKCLGLSDDRIAIAAATAILDRGYGRPTQSIDANINEDSNAASTPCPRFA